MVSNGVKQGAVINPILFCIYIDGLLMALQNAGYGCYIGNVFLVALAYANDIAIIAPTPAAMRAMLKLCDNFANDFSIIFNAKKSNCLFIASHLIRSRQCRFLPQLFIGGNPILSMNGAI